MSGDCCVAHPRGAMVCLQFVIVVFPDHTHSLFLLLLSSCSDSYAKFTTFYLPFNYLLTPFSHSVLYQIAIYLIGLTQTLLF